MISDSCLVIRVIVLLGIIFIVFCWVSSYCLGWCVFSDISCDCICIFVLFGIGVRKCIVFKL